MKIWFQMLSSETRAAAFQAASMKILEKAADPGTIVELHGSQSGGIGDHYRLLEHLDTRLIIENLARIRTGGYDAMVILNSVDPALVEAREILDIPVLSYLETTIAFAELMGEKFALIVPNDKFVSTYHALVVRYRQEARCAAIEPQQFVNIPEMEKIFTERDVQDRAIEQFGNVARRAIAKGAEVLIPCGPPTAMLSMREVREVDGVPILDGYTLCVKLAEAMVKLKSLGQPVISRARLYAKAPEHLIEHYGATYNVRF